MEIETARERKKNEDGAGTQHMSARPPIRMLGVLTRVVSDAVNRANLSRVGLAALGQGLGHVLPDVVDVWQRVTLDCF